MKKIFLVLLFVALYQGLNILFPNSYFPSVFQITQTFFKDFSGKEIYFDIFASLKRVMVGFLFASAIGIFLGLTLAYFKRLRDLRIYIEFLRPIPPIAWIPIAIIIFGLGDQSAYFIVFLGAFLPIFTNTYFGAISLPKIYENVASTFEIGRFVYLRKILLFFSFPYIFNGLKIGIGMAWMSVIAAELIASQSGLGYFIQINRLLLQTDNILIGMLIIGFIGYFLQKIIEFLEKRVVDWI